MRALAGSGWRWVVAVALAVALAAPEWVGAQGLATVSAAEQDPNYFRRSREGWFWYIDPPEPVREAELKAAPAPSPAPSPAPAPAPVPTQQARDLAAFRGFQVRFEHSLQAATANPSPANVALFLMLYAEARRKASVFSDQAQALAVRMPWLDETFSAGGRPAQPGAMRAFDSIRMQDRDQLMVELAQTHGLYFFFRARCAYCHVQAPMLRLFQQKYGFTVFAVSLDGSSLPDFPDARRDNGLAASVATAIGVPLQQFVTPAVVLARPSTREVVPVGFGAMNMDEMVDRIATVVRVRDHGPGHAVPSQAAALLGAWPAASQEPAAAPPAVRP